MALVACLECKNPISERAAFCVHCGYTLDNIQEKILESIDRQLGTIRSIMIFYLVMTILNAVAFLIIFIIVPFK